MHPAVRNKMLVAVAASLLTAVSSSAQWVSGETTAMGTSIRVELWEPAPEQGPALIEKVFAEMRRIDELMSTYKPTSELSHINDRAAHEAVVASDELFGLIERALAFFALDRWCV